MMDLELPPPGLPSQQVVPGREQEREGAAAREGHPHRPLPVCGRSSDCSGRAHAGAAALELGPGAGGVATRRVARGLGARPSSVTDNAPAAPEGDRVWGWGATSARVWAKGVSNRVPGRRS